MWNGVRKVGAVRPGGWGESTMMSMFKLKRDVLVFGLSTLARRITQDSISVQCPQPQTGMKLLQCCRVAEAAVSKERIAANIRASCYNQNWQR
jgi:hypothetical protein